MNRPTSVCINENHPLAKSLVAYGIGKRPAVRAERARGGLTQSEIERLVDRGPFVPPCQDRTGKFLHGTQAEDFLNGRRVEY